MDESESDVVLLGGQDIKVAAVDLLLNRILCGLQQIRRANLKAGCRCGEGSEEANAVGAETILRNDVGYTVRREAARSTGGDAARQ